MQVVVSISLATVCWRCVPCPGIGPAWAEMRWTRSVARLIAGLPLTQRHRDTEASEFLCGSASRCQRSCFLHLNEESFEFRRVCVRVDYSGRELIDWGEGGAAGILGDSAEAPVDGDADLVDLFAVDQHRLDAARHHGFRDVVASGARDFEFLSSPDA